MKINNYEIVEENMVINLERNFICFEIEKESKIINIIIISESYKG